MREFGQVGLPSRRSCYTTLCCTTPCYTTAGAPAIQLPRGGSLPLLSCSVRSATSIHQSQLPSSSEASVDFLRLSSKNTKSLGCHQGIETLLWPGLAGEKGGSLQRHSNSGPLCYPRQLKGAVLPDLLQQASQFRMGTFLVRSFWVARTCCIFSTSFPERISHCSCCIVVRALW